VTEAELRELLAEYLGMLQHDPSAEDFMAAMLTEDFETGFEGGHMWKGLDGLRKFLAARAGFFDEHHQIKDVLELKETDGEVGARTRLEFLLRRQEAYSEPVEDFTGSCFHSWRLRRAPDRWRVAAQIVERFEDLNENSKRLFATPSEGLNR
jgi:SnoaL-like domain